MTGGDFFSPMVICYFQDFLPCDRKLVIGKASPWHTRFCVTSRCLNWEAWPAKLYGKRRVVSPGRSHPNTIVNMLELPHFFVCQFSSHDLHLQPRVTCATYLGAASPTQGLHPEIYLKVVRIPRTKKTSLQSGRPPCLS